MNCGFFFFRLKGRQVIPRTELMQVKRIASKVNTRIKDWAGLVDRKGRDSLGMTLAEGARLVREGLDPECNPLGGRLRPITFLVSDTGAERPEAGELFELAGKAGVERISVADACFEKLSSLKNADGIALVLQFSAGATDVAAELNKGKLWLAADGVQDPGNAGALARTALAAGCGGCLFVAGVDPLSPKFLRGSMGAAYRLPCLGVTREAFVEGVTKGGFRLLVAESGSDATSFREADYRGAAVLVIGGERGVSEEVAALPGERVAIPLHGGVESLNLAVAAGVILFEAERQLYK